MNEKIKEDILSILNRLIDILRIKEEKDILEIRGLSNRTIHDASIFQDEDSVAIAVLIYALAKIIQRTQEQVDYQKLSGIFAFAVDNLNGNRIDAYRQEIKNALSFISNIDAKIKIYIQEVINQAQIKKGSKIYEHGISLSRASYILGISQWELMRYIGKTRIIDRFEEESHLTKSRLDFARKLFS